MITVEQAVYEHRKMWNWIAEKTLQRKKKIIKEDYFEEHQLEYKKRPMYNCWCCEFTEDCHLDYCKGCPLDWGNCINTCFYTIYTPTNSALFTQWNCTSFKNYREAYRLAKEIANLPINPIYKEVFEDESSNSISD